MAKKKLPPSFLANIKKKKGKAKASAKKVTGKAPKKK